MYMYLCTCTYVYLYVHFTADCRDEEEAGQGADEETKVVPEGAALVPVRDPLQRLRHQVIGLLIL